MKLRYLICALYLCSLWVHAADNTPATNALGLVAYYPLSGDANDASGNAYHGTMTDVVPTTDRFNQANGALLFNGKTSAVNIPYSLPFNVDPFTMTAWINWAGSCPNTYTDYSECVILMRENMYALAVREGTLQFAIGTLSAKTNSWQWINTDVKIQANQWTHVALQFDKGSIASVYINGKFIKSSLYPDRVLYADPFLMYYNIPLSIGRRSTLGGTPFYGALSDIRVYNRVLSVEELEQLAENNTPQPLAEIEIPANSSLNTGLVAYYPLNGNADDASGHANHGVMLNVNSSVNRFNRTNTALAFNDQNSTISTPDYIPFNTPQFTTTAWINWDGICYSRDDNECIIFSRELIYALSVRRGTLQFAIFTLDKPWSWIDTGFAVPVNKWTHVALQFNVDKLATVYVDGNAIKTEQLSSKLVSAEEGPNAYFNKGPFKIGSRNIGNTPFYGTLDEVRVYDRALSADEVKQLADNKQTVSNELNVSSSATSNAQRCSSTLEILGTAKMQNAVIPIEVPNIVFCGGIQVNSGLRRNLVTQKLGDEINITGSIKVKSPQYLGKPADVVVYASYIPQDSQTPINFMMTSENKAVLQEGTSLQSFFTFSLNEMNDFQIYKGKFIGAGHLLVYFGIRLLSDGIVIANSNPIDISISP